MEATHHSDVAKEIEKMVDGKEPPTIPHSIPFPSNQPNDHQILASMHHNGLVYYYVMDDTAYKNESEMAEMADHNLKPESSTMKRSTVPQWHGVPIAPRSVFHQKTAKKRHVARLGRRAHHATAVPESSTTPQMVNDVIIDIKAMLLNTEEPPLSTTCCIYRVPHILRDHNPKVYTPKVVSIGPFHYGNPKLENMERYKQKFFKEFIKQAQTNWVNLVSFVENIEPKVRACYSDNIKLSKKELVKVILVDATFIFQLFLKHVKKDWVEDDVNLIKPWFEDCIIMDLLLLENQLPFFILEELYNQAIPPHIQRDLPSLRWLTFQFFNCFNKQNIDHIPDFTINHFTDLVRTFYLPRTKPKRLTIEAGSHALLYSANELYEAGVKFKANTSTCLLDLKFSGGTLEIPKVLVDDLTETLFYNMIALEQCHYPYQSYIIDYALLLDWLINTSKDVDVLVQQEIICNYIGDSDNVTKLFNGLGKDFVRSNFSSDYSDICKMLNAFCKDPWNNKKTTLRRDYCKTTWQAAASIAGIMLLVLTFLQTICSVIQIA